MRFVTRTQQLDLQFKSDPHADGLGPIPNLLLHTQLAELAQPAPELSDSLLDGVTIQDTNRATRWIDENDVHGARILSRNVQSTRFLIGPQVIAVRDDIRMMSHIAVVESNLLALCTYRNSELLERLPIYRGVTQRAHVSLRKFDGRIFMLHCSARTSLAERKLYLDGRELSTQAELVDFPFMAFSQAPIGHVANEPPKFGLLSYKCRSSGRVYLRRIEGEDIGPERAISVPPCLGGMTFGVSDKRVLFSVDAIVEGRLVPMTSSSSDGGLTIAPFSPVDLKDAKVDRFLPSCSPPLVDNLGEIQVAYAAVKGDKVHVLNVVGDSIVDAMELDAVGYRVFAEAVFPKNPQDNRPAGNGITDGLGIIVTALSDGLLYVSNSQAGGRFFPKERILNNEMPKMAMYRATECCYTRGQEPNRVSMDYLFFQGDDDNNIASSTLYIETWDMPLPIPVVRATASGKRVEVEIIADAFFYLGGTTFEFDDPTIEILSIDLVGKRKATLGCNTDKLAGTTVTFTAKSTFYYHEGSAVVSQPS